MKQKGSLKIMPDRTKKVKFVGDKDGFENGRIYTLVELSKITGIKTNALQKRIGTSNFFNEHHVRPTSVYQNYGGERLKREYKPKKLIGPLGIHVSKSAIENYTILFSARWLKKRIR